MPSRVSHVILAAVIGLSACSPDDDAGGDPSPETSQEPTVEETPTSSDAAPAPLPRLTFARVGGIAGMDDELAVEPDGTFTVRQDGQERAGTLDADQRDRLAAAAAAFDPAALPAPDGDDAVADDVTYTITVDGETTEVLASQLPRPVPELVVVAQEILNGNS